MVRIVRIHKIRRHSTKFRRPGDLAAGVCTSLYCTDALPYVSCARIIKCVHRQKRYFRHMQLCRRKIAARVCLSSWWRRMIKHNQTIMQPTWHVYWRLESWWWLNTYTKSVTVSTARKLSSKSCQCLLQDVIPSFQVQSVTVIDALSHSGVS
jgi:hypothetical protein